MNVARNFYQLRGYEQPPTVEALARQIRTDADRVRRRTEEDPDAKPVAEWTSVADIAARINRQNLGAPRRRREFQRPAATKRASPVSAPPSPPAAAAKRASPDPALEDEIEEVDEYDVLPPLARAWEYPPEQYAFYNNQTARFPNGSAMSWPYTTAPVQVRVGWGGALRRRTRARATRRRGRRHR